MGRKRSTGAFIRIVGNAAKVDQGCLDGSEFKSHPRLVEGPSDNDHSINVTVHKMGPLRDNACSHDVQSPHRDARQLRPVDHDPKEFCKAFESARKDNHCN